MLLTTDVAHTTKLACGGVTAVSSSMMMLHCKQLVWTSCPLGICNMQSGWCGRPVHGPVKLILTVLVPCC